MTAMHFERGLIPVNFSQVSSPVFLTEYIIFSLETPAGHVALVVVWIKDGVVSSVSAAGLLFDVLQMSLCGLAWAQTEASVH